MKDAEIIAATADPIVTFDTTNEPDTTTNPPRLMLQKKSANPSVTDGNSAYSLSGAEYSIKKGAFSTTGTGTGITSYGSGTYTTDSTGAFTVALEEAGTGTGNAYFIKETKASTGYDLDTNTYAVTTVYNSSANNYTVNVYQKTATGTSWTRVGSQQTVAQNGTITVTSTEPYIPQETPEYPSIRLEKVSSDPTKTTGSAYSLQGAKYSVKVGSFSILSTTGYTNATSFGSGTYTTDISGRFIVTGINESNTGLSKAFYITETEPSKGYDLDTNVYAVTIVYNSTNKNYTATVYKKASTSSMWAPQWTAVGSAVTVASGGTITVTSAEPYQIQKTPPVINLQKQSGNTSITNNNSAYSLAGAKYSVKYGTFSAGNTSGYNSATDFGAGTYATDSTGKFTVSDLESEGTEIGNAYYIKETTASPGYDLDANTYAVTTIYNTTTKVYAYIIYRMNGATWIQVSTGTVAEGGTITVTSTEPPTETVTPPSINLHKVSGNTSITNGNSYYVLSGAKYSVKYGAFSTATRDGYNAAAAFGSETYTTASDGSFAVTGLNAEGTGATNAYYITETSPSQGYGLDTNVYAVTFVYNAASINYTYTIYSSAKTATTWTKVSDGTVAQGSSISVTSSEPPKAPPHISVSKVSEKPAITDGDSAFSLSGAVYSMKKGALMQLIRLLITKPIRSEPIPRMRQVHLPFRM